MQHSTPKLPTHIVRCYSPSRVPTTAVTCFTVDAVLNAVARANPADSIHIRDAVRLRRNKRARARYDAMRSLGMVRTPYGWE